MDECKPLPRTRHVTARISGPLPNRHVRMPGPLTTPLSVGAISTGLLTTRRVTAIITGLWTIREVTTRGTGLLTPIPRESVNSNINTARTPGTARTTHTPCTPYTPPRTPHTTSTTRTRRTRHVTTICPGMMTTWRVTTITTRRVTAIVNSLLTTQHVTARFMSPFATRHVIARRSGPLEPNTPNTWLVTGTPTPSTCNQGLTLVHFSARRKYFPWDTGGACWGWLGCV